MISDLIPIRRGKSMNEIEKAIEYFYKVMEQGNIKKR